MTTIRRRPDFIKDFYEKQAWHQNSTVLGIDEVGRGCLAGPVVAAAVIMPPFKKNNLIKDSKLLDHQELNKAYTWITKHCWYGVGIVHHRLIDRINIYQASLQAMSRAMSQLLTSCPSQPEVILVDAMPLQVSGFSGNVISFIHGEKKSSSIAAASIIAKVTRDRLMETMDLAIPGYDLKDHKGYSTKKHKLLLDTAGPSFIHRISFIDHISSLVDDEVQSFLPFAESLKVDEHV